MTKLTEKQVQAIRKLKPQPSKKAAYVAGLYGIHTSQVYRIWQGVCWKNGVKK